MRREGRPSSSTAARRWRRCSRRSSATRLTVTHLLRTHSHADHVEHEDELVDRFGLEVVTGSVETRGPLPRAGAADTRPPLRRRRLVPRQRNLLLFSGDTLFRDAVGGGSPAEQVRESVMETLMTLPPEVRVLPGHTDETTIGREWEENPFVRVWRGGAASIGDAVQVAGEEATLFVWSPDYDGKGKAMVSFADGREAIVGGSRVER